MTVLPENELPILRGLLLCALVLVVCQGCAGHAGARRIDPAAARLEHDVRERGVDPAVSGNPVAYTEEMRAHARSIAGAVRPLEQLRRLQQHLFDESAFPFDYKSRATLTAIEAFESREGNCVSFTSLFIALGRSLGIDVRAALQSTRDAERVGDLIVVNEHIVAIYEHSGGATAFDFNLRREGSRLGLKIVDDLAVVAIYLNNRGAEELLEDRPEQAKLFVESAIKLAPDVAATYGNLGVILRHLGDTAGAFRAYRRALAIEPGAPTILNNLAALYESLGLAAEARAALRAADVRGSTPYMLVVRGDLELTEGDVKQALRLYRRATRLDSEIPEAWIAIGRAELDRGRRDAGCAALARARELVSDRARLEPLFAKCD